MSVPQQLQVLFRYVDAHKSTYIQTLKEAVAIPSVSSVPNLREDCIKMMRWTEQQLKKLGADTELCDNGKEVIGNGKTIKRPPILLATIGRKSTKKTLCVYGHMDVFEAFKEEGWDQDPFTLVERDGKLYGRGTSDNKGPVLSWFHAIEAYLRNKLDLPVNIKFLIDCLQEMGSEGLSTFLVTKKTFFNDVSYLCVPEGSWLSTRKPCICYGMRGLLYFSVEVEGLKKDLHSGAYGGTVYEPLSDLIFILNSLQDHNGKIQVPGVMDQVLQVSPEEERMYKSVDLNVEELRNSVGALKLAHKEDKMRLLMHRWRFPSLSYHGIEGGCNEPGGKPIIPAKVIGKFSLRLVHHQEPEQVEGTIRDYLQKVFKLRKSSNKLRIQTLSSIAPWSENPLGSHYKAAMRAIKHVYKVEPDLTREGTSLPICNILLEVTERKSGLILPIGAPDDGVHGPNEKLNLRNYLEGTKVMISYLYELGQL